METTAKEKEDVKAAKEDDGPRLEHSWKVNKTGGINKRKVLLDIYLCPSFQI